MTDAPLKRHVDLARAFFSEQVVAEARATADPLEHLMTYARSIAGAGGPTPFFDNIYAFRHQGGQVQALGRDADGHTDYDRPVFEVAVRDLAVIALRGIWQQEMF